MSAASLVVCALLGLATTGTAIAADAAIPRSEARPLKTVTEVDVYPRRTRHRYEGCPDRYSCFSLYGAYGPYGGPAYWGAYTAGYYR
jgi:hypothetical protein